MTDYTIVLIWCNTEIPVLLILLCILIALIYLMTTIEICDDKGTDLVYRLSLIAAFISGLRLTR